MSAPMCARVSCPPWLSPTATTLKHVQQPCELGSPPREALRSLLFDTCAWGPLGLYPVSRNPVSRGRGTSGLPQFRGQAWGRLWFPGAPVACWVGRLLDVGRRRQGVSWILGRSTSRSPGWV